MKPPFTLPSRALQTHKGQCGRVGVVAGSPTMIGAGILTAMAALRMGTGLLYLMGLDEPSIAVLHPEIITLPLSEKGKAIAERAVHPAVQLILDYRFNVVAIGPGLGREPGTKRFVRGLISELLARTSLPIVLDAAALYAVDSDFLSHCPAYRLILTPHPGEFERLFGIFPKHRREDAMAEARHCRQIVVLKSFETVVTDGQKTYVNRTGNPGMATAGSGDVLTGVIASLIGQGMPLYEAACLGAYLHGASGDKAFEEFGIGLIASDITRYLTQFLD